MNLTYYFRRIKMLLSFNSLIARFKLQSYGNHIVIAKNTRLVTGGGEIVVGDNFIMDEFAEIFCNPIGDNTDTQPKLIIGNNVHLSKHCCIGCSNMIVLENDVRLAPYCHITDRNHVYTDINTPIWKQPSESPGPVIIGEQTWLGFGVQVMPNVKIGKHCVVAAGSIVTKDIPDYSVAAGIPAKVIKHYNLTDKKWISTTKESDSANTGGGNMLTHSYLLFSLKHCALQKFATTKNVA